MSKISINTMVDHIQATEIALKYLKQTIPDANDVRVEEVERTNDGAKWQITFGYKPKIDPSEELGSLFTKKYKQVTLTADSGEFVSIKSRIAG